MASSQATSASGAHLINMPCSACDGTRMPARQCLCAQGQWLSVAIAEVAEDISGVGTAQQSMHLPRQGLLSEELAWSYFHGRRSCCISKCRGIDGVSLRHEAEHGALELRPVSEAGCEHCRSKTQGIALSLGDKLILKQKG